MSKKYFLHPFLFAMYPVLFLYSENVRAYTAGSLIIPLLLVLTFTGIVYLITKFIVKKSEVTAVITTSIVITLLSYNRILEYFQKFANKQHQQSLIELGLVLCLPALLALIIFSTLKFQNKLLPINKLLTVIAVVLIAFNLIPTISYEIRAKKPFFPKQEEITSKQPINPQDPDIYYIVFDRYAGPKTTTEQYDFDNSEIYEFLTDRGFYVASESASNYPKTFLSFASSLNMEYVNYLTKQTKGGASSDETVVNPLIRNNKVMQFLKERGYTYVQLGSWWQPTAINPHADIVFASTKGTYPFVKDEFTTGFLNTTIAPSIQEYLFRDEIDVSTDPWNNNHRQKMFYQFGIFADIVKVPGPKFVFAHILAPHDPFVVDKNCTPIPETEVKKHNHVYNYLEQIQCVNTNMKKIVDQIQKGSKTPPIIVIQSDEGPFPMIKQIDSKQSWSKATDQQLAEKFPILNAYYLPNSLAQADLYPSISPVNSFKVVFNNYFGTNYNLLPDKYYIFKDENHYYQFIDVTDRLK